MVFNHEVREAQRAEFILSGVNWDRLAFRWGHGDQGYRRVAASRYSCLSTSSKYLHGSLVYTVSPLSREAVNERDSSLR